MTTMGLNFRNSTNAAIFVVFAYPDFSCTPVNYSKTGWYRVNPGQTVQLWSGYAGGNTFFYYAEDDFGREWRGHTSLKFLRMPSIGAGIQAVPLVEAWDCGESQLARSSSTILSTL